MSRVGPSLKIVTSCDGCDHEHSDSYSVPGDWGQNVYCTHPEAKNKRPTTGLGYIGDTTWKTPSWCPILDVSALDLIKQRVASMAQELAPQLPSVPVGHLFGDGSVRVA